MYRKSILEDTMGVQLLQFADVMSESGYMLVLIPNIHHPDIEVCSVQAN